MENKNKIIILLIIINICITLYCICLIKDNKTVIYNSADTAELSYSEEFEEIQDSIDSIQMDIQDIHCYLDGLFEEEDSYNPYTNTKKEN